jgi:hypothetical protein
MDQKIPVRIAERRPTEELYDIKEATHLALDHGERFIGWYMFKNSLKERELPLNYPGDKDKKYSFKIYDYNFRFIMPPSLEFSSGVISYSEAERRFGMFRFPQKHDGTFSAPILNQKKSKNPLKDLSKDQIRDLVGKRKVLTFEAFRIPQYGFEQVFINDKDLDKIASITDRSFARDIRREFESVINKKVSEVKEKIKSSPDYLLILKNVLNLQWKNVEEVSTVTNKIIHR